MEMYPGYRIRFTIDSVDEFEFVGVDDEVDFLERLSRESCDVVLAALDVPSGTEVERSREGSFMLLSPRYPEPPFAVDDEEIDSSKEIILLDVGFLDRHMRLYDTIIRIYEVDVFLFHSAKVRYKKTPASQEFRSTSKNPYDMRVVVVVSVSSRATIARVGE